MYGKEVVVGDCVLVNGEDVLNAMNASLEENSAGNDNDNGDNSGANGDVATTSTTDTDANTGTNSNSNSKLTNNKIDIHIVTAADVEANAYKMTDVVVPILGNSIEVPDLLRPFYEELLIKDDLTMDCFNTSGNGTRINIILL